MSDATWEDLLIEKHLGYSGFGKPGMYPAGHPLYEEVRTLVEEAAAAARRVALEDAERACREVGGSLRSSGDRACENRIRAITRWDGNTQFKRRKFR